MGISKQNGMNMRITKSMLENRMKYLCKLMGKDLGFEKGNWNLDNYPLAGGWIVVEFLENGGEHHPLCCTRMDAGEMFSALEMAISCLQMKNNGV
jgi:hypothetical protein